MICPAAIKVWHSQKAERQSMRAKPSKGKAEARVKPRRDQAAYGLNRLEAKQNKDKAGQRPNSGGYNNNVRAPPK